MLKRKLIYSLKWFADNDRKGLLTMLVKVLNEGRCVTFWILDQQAMPFLTSYLELDLLRHD